MKTFGRSSKQEEMQPVEIVFCAETQGFTPRDAHDRCDDGLV